MINRLLQTIDQKKHIKEEITEALLYKNRFMKSGFIILSILGALSISQISLSLVTKDIITIKSYSDLVNYYTVFVFITGLFILPYHFSHYGLNNKNLKLNLILGLTIGSVLAAIVIFLRIYSANNGVASSAFTFKLKFTDIVYPLFVLSQEMVMKGYIQGYFIILFGEGRKNKFTAIFIASWIFAMLHSAFGIYVFMLVFLYAILTGYLFEKTRSVIGVSIIHYAAGAALYYFSSLT